MSEPSGSQPAQPIADELKFVQEAAAAGKLSEGAVTNLTAWLTEPRYAEYVPQVTSLIQNGKWQELDDVFWTEIPFGTGGRRGKMYPIGSNAINDRTIGESAQGLADYVKEVAAKTGPEQTELSCAIAYDTRHRSREFAELCAGIMAANGFVVWFLDGHRSTPELSFAVRRQGCSCGIMITASHNPPSDNAVKVYWSTGGQLLHPHDRGVIEKVKQVDEIQRMPFQEALEAGKVVYCQEEVDAAFLDAVAAQVLPGPRKVKVLYSPLHGVGSTAVLPVLAKAGFETVDQYGPHAEPSGDFPNVPGHVANPENAAVFLEPIKYAQAHGYDLILATDPDCDRLGCAAPQTQDTSGPWQVLTGNQIGALLTEYILAARKQAGTLSRDHYVVKTLVTTELIRRIADSYQVKTVGDLLVGFKYIGGVMDDLGTEEFLLGTEESHGYLVGDYARDKDGSVAALLLTALAARCQAEKKTLGEQLDALFWQYGCHAERTVSVTMPGSEGMSRMQEVMASCRTKPPLALGGMQVAKVRDYQSQTLTVVGRTPEPLAGPKGDLVIFDLAEEGNSVAVRPSGTEPKIKFYTFAFEPAEQLANLEDAKDQLNQRLDALEKDLKAFAGVS